MALPVPPTGFLPADALITVFVNPSARRSLKAVLACGIRRVAAAAAVRGISLSAGAVAVADIGFPEAAYKVRILRIILALRIVIGPFMAGLTAQADIIQPA
jgi:hypothetical protein